MNDAAVPHDHIVACHECDLVQRVVDVPIDAPGNVVLRCRRCNGVLLRHPGKPLDHAVAWSLAGLILLLLANIFPVVTLSVSGQHTETSLFSGALALSRAGQFGVAVLVIGVLIVAPALLFLLQVGILLPLRFGRVVPYFTRMMRLLTAASHWLMFDVFMLAIIVAMVKLSHLAEVSPGYGLWAFLALMLASVASATSYDLHSVWACYADLSRRDIPPVAHRNRTAAERRFSALSRGLVCCPACGLLSHWSGNGEAQRKHCPRCGAVLHRRKMDSLGRTWALLIAGYILLIPANILPITFTRSLFGVQADTIMSSVAYFWHDGAYDLAIVIFTASIFVPLAKLLALTFLTYSAQRRMRWEPLQRTRLYRMVEFVGKWSMLDIFVVALLAQLVQFSSLASIDPGPGAIAFAAVVVITMFAAMSFDSRLLWDPQEQRHSTGGTFG